MNWKSKINTIVFCCLICLVAASAYTATFTNKEAALAALGKPQDVQIGECKIANITERIQASKANESKIIANIVLNYSINGKESTSAKTIQLSNSIEKDVLIAAGNTCEELKTETLENYAEPLNLAIVDYMQGTLISIKDKTYDYSKKAWGIKK